MSEERYEKITAIITDGGLLWNYKITTSDVHGSHQHDEDVSNYTDKQIVDLTCSTLAVDDDQRKLIELVWN